MTNEPGSVQECFLNTANPTTITSGTVYDALRCPKQFPCQTLANTMRACTFAYYLEITRRGFEPTQWLTHARSRPDGRPTIRRQKGPAAAPPDVPSGFARDSRFNVCCVVRRGDSGKRDGTRFEKIASLLLGRYLNMLIERSCTHGLRVNGRCWGKKKNPPRKIIWPSPGAGKGRLVMRGRHRDRRVVFPCVFFPCHFRQRECIRPESRTHERTCSCRCRCLRARAASFATRAYCARDNVTPHAGYRDRGKRGPHKENGGRWVGQRVPSFLP